MHAICYIIGIIIACIFIVSSQLLVEACLYMVFPNILCLLNNPLPTVN